LAAINRRALLKSLAATAFAGYTRTPVAQQALRVVVAGAGIVGASIAYHLAKAGATVTVIDQQAPASHASRGTFAWINATWAKQPRHYHALSQASVAYWHELQAALRLPVRWGGSLEWFEDAQRQEELAAQIDEQFDWGEPARMVDAAEFSRLEPNIAVAFRDGWAAALSGNDGATDPVAATHALLNAAGKMGARVAFPCELIDARMRHSKLIEVTTSTGTLRADRLVLATGAAAEITHTVAQLEIPQRSRPGVIVITEPLPELLQHIIVAPGIHMHQRTDGRIVIGEQAGAPQNEAHALRLADRPNDFPSEALGREHAERILAAARPFLPELSHARIAQTYIGWRPLPIDGHPVVGASTARPDVYLAIMHSGVTLAPLIGKLAAQEIVQGMPAASLDAFRPDRNFETVRRY
jgi:glycine/D-amino acid oxidase-like deaminating enzyme